jgi:hypothetical protein
MKVGYLTVGFKLAEGKGSGKALRHRESFSIPAESLNSRPGCPAAATGMQNSHKNRVYGRGGNRGIHLPDNRCGHVDSRVGGGALTRWPPSAAQTAGTHFVQAAFTKTQLCRDAREGIKSSRRTSLYSP